MPNDRHGTPQLSVVIPAYNEQERLGGSLEKIKAYLDERGLDTEILVVDDGSTDATAKIAGNNLRHRPGRVLCNPENRGKGFSVRRGVLAAAARWVLLTDADLSTPIEEHERLAATAREHDLDLVIGSRGLPDSRVEIRQNWLRQSMGKTFNGIVRAMTGLSFHDTQCGFKLVDATVTRPIFERMVIDRFAYDVELLFLCSRYGLRMMEVPVIWRNAPGSKVTLLGDPLNMLRDVARVRWRFRRGLYHPPRDDWS